MLSRSKAAISCGNSLYPEIRLKPFSTSSNANARQSYGPSKPFANSRHKSWRILENGRSPSKTASYCDDVSRNEQVVESNAESSPRQIPLPPANYFWSILAITCKLKCYDSIFYSKRKGCRKTKVNSSSFKQRNGEQLWAAAKVGMKG